MSQNEGLNFTNSHKNLQKVGPDFSIYPVYLWEPENWEGSSLTACKADADLLTG